MSSGRGRHVEWREELTRGVHSAITHGISHLVGQVAVGTLADLVLWKPENFGIKPEMVLKSGVIAWAQVRPPLPRRGARAASANSCSLAPS